MITGVLNHSLTRAVCWYLCFFLVCIHVVPSTANASFISTAPHVTGDLIDSTSGSLQTDLEKKLIAERLAAIGLSTEEISVRVEDLSGEELEAIVSALDELQAGGNKRFGLEEELRWLIIIDVALFINPVWAFMLAFPFFL
jgi:hypothetical protein